MQIPRYWRKASSAPPSAAVDAHPVSVWGWGDTEDAARAQADSRLKRLLDRLVRGETMSREYGYGTRPLREAVLEVIAGSAESPEAVITRNQYGSLVLNTSSILFVDVDVPPPTLASYLGTWFGRTAPADAALDVLRAGLVRTGWGASFRLYQTAAGFRALAIDRRFDPVDQETTALMAATGADPAFAQLCRVQRSFRARLTPKPWRCGCLAPPSGFLPGDTAAPARFATWLATYEAAGGTFATCRYLETVGSGRPAEWAQRSIGTHDALTRCDTALPLA